jgi:hypothetical protein
MFFWLSVNKLDNIFVQTFPQTFAVILQKHIFVSLFVPNGLNLTLS